MGISGITLRDNTERLKTIEIDTNELIGTNPAAIKLALDKLFTGRWRKSAIPKLWNEKAAERFVKQLIEIYG